MLWIKRVMRLANEKANIVTMMQTDKSGMVEGQGWVSCCRDRVNTGCVLQCIHA